MEAHLVDRQGVRLHDFQAVNRRRHTVPGCPLREVLAGVHRYHTGHQQRLGGVDAGDAGVRMGRSHKAGVQGLRQYDVVDVLAPPRDQSRVFSARIRHADVAKSFSFHGGRPPASGLRPMQLL